MDRWAGRKTVQQRTGRPRVGARRRRKVAELTIMRPLGLEASVEFKESVILVGESPKRPVPRF